MDKHLEHVIQETRHPVAGNYARMLSRLKAEVSIAKALSAKYSETEDN